MKKLPRIFNCHSLCGRTKQVPVFWFFFIAGFGLLSYIWLVTLGAFLELTARIGDGNHQAKYSTDDRLVQLLKKDREHVQVVVLWTAWFGDPDWDEFWTVGDRLVHVPENETQKCYLTTSRRYMPKASAIVFHGRDLRFSEMPRTRFRWQRYVFFLLESPVNAFFDFAHWVAADVVSFNWTMSYRPSADVYTPYVWFDNRSDAKISKNGRRLHRHIQQLALNFINKTKGALWLSSNCDTSGHREKLVQTLEILGLPVDVYGACSEWPGDRPGSNETDLFAPYRFYLAFENSLCDDYVTEKAMRALQLSQRFGLIPIVFGRADYASLLPSGSFIDALSFDNVEAFAGRLIDLATTRDAKLIEPYFAWQVRQYVDTGSLKTHLIRGMTVLCRRLWLADLRHCASAERTGSRNNTQTTTKKNAIDSHQLDCSPASSNKNENSKTYSSVTNLRATFGDCRL